MAKYPKYTKRVTRKFVIISIATLLAASNTITCFLIARKHNVNLGLEEPYKDKLANIENLGNESNKKPAGSTGLEYGKEEAENAFNSASSSVAVNKNLPSLDQFANKSVSFEYTSNGMPVKKEYTMNADQQTYTVVEKDIITLPSGLVVEGESKRSSGSFKIEDGLIYLFEDSGLNAGNVILNKDSATSNQYADILFLGEDGNIYSTITGTAIAGTVTDLQNVNNQQNTPTV